MNNSNSGSDDRGNLEKLGGAAGAMAGRAADFGMEVSGAIFKSAAEMLGGWWSSDEPRQAAGAWNEQENNYRSHFQASAGSSSGTGATSGVRASGSVGGVSGSVSAGGSTGDSSGSTGVAPKSQHGAMQTAGKLTTAEDGSGAYATGGAQIGDTRVEGALSMDSASDGFARARPGYQLGYVARQNPAYRGRSFTEVEPELRKVWESRAKTEGGSSSSSSSWPEVRGFVDFAYQQGGDKS